MLKKTALILLTIVILFAAYVLADINSIKIKEYVFSSQKIGDSFNNFKIALITDFHNSENFSKVIEKTRQISPDIITIGGDSVNLNQVFSGNLMWLLEELHTVAPIYFISGNHEVWSDTHDEIISQVEKYGVKILNNKATVLKRGDNSINLIGYRDIIYSDDAMRLNVMEEELNGLYEKIENKELFNILLFHRANYFDLVSEFPFDLVLSGHTHGGQINLPFIKELIMEKTLYSSKYVKGLYEKKGSAMIVSAGLERNLSQLRIFNTPEIVSITLKSAR